MHRALSNERAIVSADAEGRLIMNKKKCLMKAATLAVLMGSSVLAWAGGGTSIGGGGDGHERMFDELRADLLKWIAEGGHEGLSYPADVNAALYRAKMEQVLMPHVVIVEFVTTQEESAAKDSEKRAQVDGVQKTCRGFVSKRKKMVILCNSERFDAALPAERYRLVHHEYAGLAGMERNQGPSSDYQLSNQLGEFLRTESVLRLGLRRKEPSRVAKVCGYQRLSRLTNEELALLRPKLLVQVNLPCNDDPYASVLVSRAKKYECEISAKPDRQNDVIVNPRPLGTIERYEDHFVEYGTLNIEGDPRFATIRCKDTTIVWTPSGRWEDAVSRMARHGMTVNDLAEVFAGKVQFEYEPHCGTIVE
jgi:hypothetical protein